MFVVPVLEGGLLANEGDVVVESSEDGDDFAVLERRVDGSVEGCLALVEVGEGAVDEFVVLVDKVGCVAADAEGSDVFVRIVDDVEFASLDVVSNDLNVLFFLLLILSNALLQ